MPSIAYMPTYPVASRYVISIVGQEAACPHTGIDYHILPGLGLSRIASSKRSHDLSPHVADCLRHVRPLRYMPTDFGS